MMLAQSSGGGSPIFLLLILGMPVLLWIMMRNQKRKVQQQQTLQRAAQVGDEIMTTAGIFGTIVDEDEDEDTVIVEIAPGTQIKMVRAGIARRVTEDDEVDEYEDDDVAEEDEPDDADGGWRRARAGRRLRARPSVAERRRSPGSGGRPAGGHRIDRA
jgi:preprotein translocase subunit YajC